MKYRPEIDGLRALAVLPVILFHAGFSIFAGGYVGVDVFFVISGYLITTILISEREAGTYSLLGFYERRARRILPALFLILLCTIPFAWWWLPPDPFEDYARSEAFAALFISNVHFLEHTSYYDIESALRPLLHTWSLAVEEQYYLLFPLVLLPLGAFVRRKFVAVFLILAALSLAVAEWGWRNYPSENFYFTFSRLWEILAGSICAAILFARPRMRSNALSLSGLLLILYSIFFYDAAVPFPSVYTLVPVVGTGLIILYAERGTWVATMLSWTPMVWVGLISYSAYLWHQPLFAFARIRSITEPSLWLMVVLSGITIILAYLTLKFVETPFRRRRLLSGRGAVLGGSAAGIAAISAVGFTGLSSQGFPSRIYEETPGFLTELLKGNPTDKAPGVRADENPSKQETFGEIYVPDEPLGTVAILGDSHSGAIRPAFHALSKERRIQVMGAEQPGCPPLLGVYLAKGGSKATTCHDWVEKAAREVVDRQVDAVFLVARWSLYATGGYGDDEFGYALGPLATRQIIGADERLENFRKTLQRTVTFYEEAGIDVFVVQEVPLQMVAARNQVARAILLALDEEKARDLFANQFVSTAKAASVQGFADNVLANVARRTQAIVVPTLRHFQVGDEYPWFAGDQLLYLDDNHLSVNGAKRLQSTITKAYDAHRSFVVRQ